MSNTLLVKLKENCLTIELNKHVPIVTGTLPHDEHLCWIKELKNVSVSLKEDVKEFRQCLEDCVDGAIDNKAKADGGIIQQFWMRGSRTWRIFSSSASTNLVEVILLLQCNHRLLVIVPY
jgi:hypothetical protein